MGVAESRALRLNAGFCTETGRREHNQDYVGTNCDVPRTGGSDYVAAIADGVSHGAGGRVASEIAVRGFIDGYDTGNPTLGVARNAGSVVAAINNWLHTVAAADKSISHASTTFTAVVMAGRDAHIIHVGDSRAYHLRDEHLTRLTRDHTRPQPEQDHILIRAIGMEANVRLDHRTQSLRPHDRLMLTTDGVHGVLNDERLRSLLLRRRSPDEDAREIVTAALDAGSQDNATCLIVDILEIPETGTPELLSHFANLPMLPPPEPGESVDDFLIGEVLSEGRYSRLMHAKDTIRGSNVVLKFPQHQVASASTYHQAFVREGWVSARLQSPYIGETIAVPADRQTRLYSAMPFYAGVTLETRLKKEPPVSLKEGMGIAQKLSKAIATLHRANIIHRDIKPENVLIEDNGGLRLIDLGVVRLPTLEEFPAGDIPGTPSFMAPELFDGKSGDEFSDQFALGVTLYRMFTGHYPYGEIEPFTRPRFNQPAALARYRPDLPAWVGHLLQKAIQPDPAQRFGDVLEFLLELDNGMERGEQIAIRRASLYERNPLRFWQYVSALLALALLASLALHVLQRGH
jgi:serine/threonine protein kinase